MEGKNFLEDKYICKVYLDNEYIGKTKKSEKSGNPKWNQTINPEYGKIKIFSSSQHLLIEIYTKHFLKKYEKFALFKVNIFYSIFFICISYKDRFQSKNTFKMVCN